MCQSVCVINIYLWSGLKHIWRKLEGMVICKIHLQKLYNPFMNSILGITLIFHDTFGESFDQSEVSL